jgi:hypothetical protein
MPVAPDPTKLLCEAIVRISGGGSAVSYGEYIRDEEVERTFDAAFGVLKSAKKKGFVTFEGELLLKGPHDKVIIALTSTGIATAGLVDARREVDVFVPDISSFTKAANIAPGTSDVPTRRAAEVLETLTLPSANARSDERRVVRDDSIEIETFAPPSSAVGHVELEALTPVSQATIDQHRSPSSMQGESGLSRDFPKQLTVDTSFIDMRTADTGISASRQDSGGQSMVSVAEPTGKTPSTAVKKLDTGKWCVDTSYISIRQTAPNRAEHASKHPMSLESNEPIVAPPVSMKDEEGKWCLANTSYINQRTRVVENLDGRKNLTKVAQSPSESPSETVKKDVDGRWKVNTAYIGYHTRENFDRKFGKVDSPAPQHYSVPSKRKYSFAELAVPLDERPCDVDPSMKEAYLTDDEFQKVFEMSVSEFSKMPRWRQQALKKAKKLF